MFRNTLLALLGLLLLAPAALATTFIVPTDEELIAKADAIVIATIRSHSVTTVPEIQTVYEIRIDRVLKGRQSTDQLLRIVSPGGELKDRGVIVPGAAHFADGDRALLFLTRGPLGWTPTDMTLGKFNFKTTTRGASVLVRDTDDIFAWDRSGNEHVENMRGEDAFLRFIEAAARGERPQAGYFVSSSDVILQDSVAQDSVADMTLQPNAPAFPAHTYTAHRPLNGVDLGTRWPNMATAGATFYKRSDTNIAGAADGGVSVIQNALAAWNNECGSVINLIYGGQRATPSQDLDGISVVEFNDPQNRLGGSFTGQGLVATTFLSYNNPHSFAGTQWWSIFDADVVFQDGYTASNPSFPTATTHEIGHGIGWRHSDAHYLRPTGFDEPCQPAVEECSSNAIMTATAISSLGFNLQTWDINAAQAVYPGGLCGGTVRQKTPADFNGDGRSDLVVYRNGAWVRYDINNGAILSSVQTPVYPGGIPVPADYDGDGRTDYSTYRPGAAWHFFNADGSYRKGIWIGVAGDIPVPADYDGDGKEDVVVYRGGTWVAYDFNTGAVKWSVTTGSVPGGIPLPMDYDGDGTADFTVYRPGAAWHFYNDNGSYFKGVWIGVAGDIPVPGDYNGDGKEEPVVFRGGWWVTYDVTSGQEVRRILAGAGSYNGDPIQPSPLDYDGDKSVDFTIFASGPWYIFNDDGSLNHGVWAGGARGDLAISRRDHTSSTPP